MTEQLESLSDMLFDQLESMRDITEELTIRLLALEERVSNLRNDG